MAAAESGDANTNGATRMVTLITSDNTLFEVDEAAASLSTTLNRMMLEGGGGRDGISVPNVDAVTLSKVLEYCMQHGPGPGVAAASTKALEMFDMEFVQIDQSMLYSVLMAAHHLEIEGLMDLVCRKVADMIKGRSPQQIRRVLGIPDPTPEEEAEMQANHWAYDFPY